MRLGISLYPDQSTFAEDKAYLQLAKSYGFDRVFMSFLQIDIDRPKHSVQRIRESIQAANELQMQVTLDIHPMVFKFIDGDETDLCYFHELGVHTLRLDAGYDGKTEAMMTHNPYGIHIEVNMSRDTSEYQRILEHRPNRECLCGSHNFYPQSYTGLSLRTFQTCSEKFAHAGIKGAAFLTSQCARISPWPVSEGLCTLEAHRYLPLELQFRHMKMLQLVDTIFIGNAYASEAELKQLAYLNQSSMDTLTIEPLCPTDFEKQLLFEEIQEYRGDASDYVIRSTKHRMKCAKKALPPHDHPSEIHRGDVLILNETFGQYKGEIQIALCDRPGDERINLVGRIKPEELLLLDELRPFQQFRLMEDQT